MAKTPTTTEDTATPPDQPGADSVTGDTDLDAKSSAMAAAHATEAEAAAAAAAAAAEAEAATAAAAAEAPSLDLPTLSYLERYITQMNVTGHRSGLVDELRDLYAAVITEDAEDGSATVAMMGITTDPADSLQVALDNWGNAARRAIAEALA